MIPDGTTIAVGADGTISTAPSSVPALVLGGYTATLAPGDVSYTSTVVFDTAWATAPRVVISTSNPNLIASVVEVSDTQFTATITAAVAVTVDTIAQVSWIAGLGST